MRDRWNIDGWRWIRDTQLHYDPHRYRGNGAGEKATLLTASLYPLMLPGYQTTTAGIQAMKHNITVLLAG